MFLLLPVGVEYRASRHPVVTYSLMGICAGMYLLNLAAGLLGGGAGFESFFFTFALVPAASHLHAWITACFMHAGLFHLLGNMVYLYLFGSCLEDILGRPKYVGFFLIAGIISNLSHVLFTPGHFASTTPLVGASGAISACMGAFAVLLRRTKVEFRFLYFFLFAIGAREFSLPSWLVLSFWFLSDILGMFVAEAEGGGGVAFAAHVGGFILGASVGAVMRAQGWTGDTDEQPEVPVPVFQPLPTRSSPTRIRVGPSAAPAEVAEAEEPAFFVHTQAGQAGPFPLGSIRGMLEVGSVAASDLFWDAPANCWRPLAELPPPGS